MNLDHIVFLDETERGTGNGFLPFVAEIGGLWHTVAEGIVEIGVEVGGLLNLVEELHGGQAGAGLQSTGGETGHEGAGEGCAIDLTIFIVSAGLRGKSMAVGADVGFQCASGAGAKGAERDVVVVLEVGFDTAHAQDAVGICGGDDGSPGGSGGLVACRVADQHAFAGCHVAGFGHIGGAVHLPHIITLLAVAERAADNLGTVFVGPFHGLHPPNFLFERLQIDLGAGEEELSPCGETHLLCAIGDAGSS